MIISGLLMITLESKVILSETNMQLLKQYFNLLIFPKGKSYIYGLIGLLVLSTADLCNIILGLMITIYAILIYKSAKKVYLALNELHTAKFTKSYLISQFKSFDTDRNGYLTTSEFASLCKSLGTFLRIL